jgi:DNA ligase-associated metallophosphoesterase
VNVAPIEIAGEAMLLDAGRALVWPRMRTVIVADVHFGKAHVLRRAGVALPRGSTSGDLARLDALVEKHRPERLLVLGDVVHGPAVAEAEWLSRVREWRAKHAALDVTVVRGNHDRHYDPAQLGFAVTGTLVEGPFVFAHDPKRVPGHYVLAGHVHPGVVLTDGGERIRLPVFWLQRDVGVLPAFGVLTGIFAVEPEAEDRLIACARDALVPLNPRAFVVERGKPDRRQRKRF